MKRKSESAKVDRKTAERNRRIHMKGLCFKLASLLPPYYLKHSNKDTVSQQDQLENAAAYIKCLKERIETLKKTKEQAIRSSSGANNNTMDAMVMRLGFPVVDLRDFGSSIEVVLITGLNKNFMLYQVIAILEQEGAQVVTASYSTVGDKVFHTIHAEVRFSRVGVETSRVCERLQELIYKVDYDTFLC